MSQNEIARAMNIGQGLFSMKVNGQRRFSVPEAIKLAEILQLNFEDFKQIWRNAWNCITGKGIRTMYVLFAVGLIALSFPIAVVSAIELSKESNDEKSL